MQQSTQASQRLSIGIDLGDRDSQICVLDPQTGEVAEEAKLRSSRKAFQQRFESMKPATIAIESGGHTPWVSRLLEQAGHEVVVANPRRTRLIYQNNSKSDRVDAEMLARLVTADRKLLYPVQPRSADTQAARAIVKARDAAVTTRTKLVNSIRGMVKSMGERLPSCDAACFHRKIRSHIPEALEPAVSPLFEVLVVLERQIRLFDKAIEHACRKTFSETERLRQITGVGPITALWYVLTLEDPTRFKNSRNVGSFVGLRPARRSSGQSDPELRITKAGDRMLRRYLVQSAQYILGRHGPDCDLQRWGLKLAGRGGKKAKRRAIVAVARKLSVLLHRLWISGEPYEPLRNSEAEVSTSKTN